MSDRDDYVMFFNENGKLLISFFGAEIHGESSILLGLGDFMGNFFYFFGFASISSVTIYLIYRLLIVTIFLLRTYRRG